MKMITTDNKIGETGATSLSEALKSNSGLTCLNLKGLNIINTSCSTNTNHNPMSWLFSTENSFEDDCAKVFSEALKNNTSLTHLELTGECKNHTEVKTQ